jgi:hypothetical protein
VQRGVFVPQFAQKTVHVNFDFIDEILPDAPEFSGSVFYGASQRVNADCRLVEKSQVC